MKKLLFVFACLLTVTSLAACGIGIQVQVVTSSTGISTVATTSASTTVPTTTVPTTPPTTVPTTAATIAPTMPPHSPLYIPDVPVEDVIRYFNEVCLDAEYHSSGSPDLLQKWSAPIRYVLNGSCTDEDMAVLDQMVDWLNALEGFPGICQAEEDSEANLQIHFCTYDELIAILGEQLIGADGGVTFWYDNANNIYRAIICYCTEIDQAVRNSVILEEIYNGLGPIQDTSLREDSLIYTGYSTPQWMTEMDELILKLLYHPQMKCGMTAAECEAVIRKLYY